MPALADGGPDALSRRRLGLLRPPLAERKLAQLLYLCRRHDDDLPPPTAGGSEDCGHFVPPLLLAQILICKNHKFLFVIFPPRCKSA